MIDAGVVVGLVTGRPLEKARAMAGIERAAYATNHGLEIWLDGQAQSTAEVDEYAAAARRVLEEVAGLSGDGVVVEDKGPVLAFHYRQAVDQNRARSRILESIRAAPASAGFVVHEGRKVVELRPPLALNKGTALTDLAGRLGCGSVLCVGDDTTDIDMFRAANEGGLPAASVAVANVEAAPELLEAADFRVEGVAGVEWLLGELLSAIRSRS
jgi:trehalose 6-phosphate phosphatase